jgi:hypothetical protein
MAYIAFSLRPFVHVHDKKRSTKAPKPQKKEHHRGICIERDWEREAPKNLSLVDTTFLVEVDGHVGEDFVHPSFSNAN